MLGLGLLRLRDHKLGSYGLSARCGVMVGRRYGRWCDVSKPPRSLYLVLWAYHEGSFEAANEVVG